ncbi:hypothetical protein LCGC14_2640200, partial [marine sediment metagenome]
TDITNHLLPEGWNVVAIIQAGTVTSAQLGNGLGASWVTISRYNQSKEFQNYNNGSSTNNDMSFKKGDVVFFNLNADTYWENQTWDTDSNYNAEGIYNLTNTTNDWNVFGIQNQSGRTLGQIEALIFQNNIYSNISGLDVISPSNVSFQVADYFNNTAINTRKFVVHPANYTLNNGTPLDFGEVAWINYNSSYNLSTSLGEVGFFTVNRSRMVT